MILGPYAVEKDYSHYVSQASKIIFAVVGTATRGPINKPTVCTSPRDLIAKFGVYNPDSLGLYAAKYFLNKYNKLWYVRAATSDATESTVSIEGTGSSGTIEDAIVLKSIDKGTYVDDYTVKISEVSGDTFKLELKDKSGNVVETLSNVSLKDISENNFKSIYLKFSSKSSAATSVTAGDYPISGGNDGINGITSEEYLTAGKTLESDNVDMNLCAVPGVSDAKVIDGMLYIAETRKDFLYLVDPENHKTVDEVKAWHNDTEDYEHTKLNSSYGALYYSWQTIYDPTNGVDVDIPPSAVAAVTIADSVYNSDIWYAPAGLKRGLVHGVISPVTTPDTAQMNDLYTGSNSVNCIINDPQVGLCIFGQKTLLRSNSALNRINVRLLMNYIKRITVAATRILTFDPNDRVTWNNFEDIIEPTLKNIQRRRGIYEYRIVKGEEIVTDTDIDNYRMPCMVMIRPTKTAEEIPIYFTLTNTGADFNDVLANDGLPLNDNN